MTTQPKKTQIEFLETNSLKFSLKNIKDSLNQATLNGTFDLDKTYQIQLDLVALSKALDTLDKFQKHYMYEAQTKEKLDQ
jgi:hypothetical protein